MAARIKQAGALDVELTLASGACAQCAGNEGGLVHTLSNEGDR